MQLLCFRLHGTFLTSGFVRNHRIECGTNDTQQTCCISWSTGQPKQGWCWEMPRRHEQSLWTLGPLHKLLVPRPEDIIIPSRHDASMRQMEWRFSHAQRTSWSAMSSGNHEAYHLQHVICSHCAGNLPAIQTLSEDAEVQRLKLGKFDTF